MSDRKERMLGSPSTTKQSGICAFAETAAGAAGCAAAAVVVAWAASALDALMSQVPCAGQGKDRATLV
jgi:hypothetical protein